jgi:hypothetical protein
MANPNILLNGLRPAQGVQSAMLGAQQGNQIAQMPMRNRLLEAQTQGAELSNQAAEQQMTRQQAEFMLKDAAIDAMKIKELAQTDPMRAQVAIAQRIKKIQDRGGDPSDTLGVRQALIDGNMAVFNAELDAVINGAQQTGLLNNGSNIPTAIQDRNDLISRLPKDAQGNLLPVEQMNAEQKAIAVEAGLIPRAGVVTGTQREATDPALGEQVTSYVSGQAGAKSGASEQAKSDVQLEMKPKIQSAIKEAETIAKERGEALSSFGRAQAAMPGLQEVVGKLKALADVATYTVGGKAFDTVSRQLGFGATEGSTARAKMESLVDNQVLPLLRDTFGAAFTAAEGDRLRNAMMNPDSAPEEKKAQLDTFLEQKMRDLEAKEAELGGNNPGGLSAGAIEDGYRFKGGNPADPSNWELAK